MLSVFNFKPSPLSLALKANAVTLLMLMAHAAEARVVTGADEYVRPGPAPDRFELKPGSGLTVDGTVTKDIRADSASLVVKPGSSTQDIIAFHSQIQIDGSDVIARNTADAAVRATGSNVSINNSNVIHNNGTGLIAGRSLGGTNGSNVRVVNSTITGTSRGASASAYSVLDFTGSHVEATNANGVGVALMSATAYMVDSRIVGGANGVQMAIDPSSGIVDNTLVLDGSSVEGTHGAAILTRAGTNADIQVRNGSTLTGGNGNLLEVTGDSTANMNVDNSFLVGDVVVEEGSTAKLQLNNGAWLTGQLKNVAELSVNDASAWMLVGDSEVGDLKMGGGAVHFGGADEFYRLDVQTLEGNGTFVMHTDFSNGQTDFLNVEGRAEGNHSLLLAASGSELANGEAVHVVHTGGGSGQFALVGDTVDVGAYAYGLKQEGTDWYLDPSRRGTSTSAHSVLAVFNSAPTVLYGESSILRTRMGELRFSEGSNNGLWMRSYGNKYEVASNKNGAGYSQTQKGFTIGADAPLSSGDGQWLAGVMAGHSTSDLSLNRGSKGEVKSYYLGAYATWLDDESGLYFDGVAKLNRLHNDVNVTMSDGKKAKGNYAQNAVGASAEVGRHIKLDDGYFVEPYSQLSATITQAQSYQLDNGLQAKGDRSAVVVGKAGVTVGKNIQLDSGGVLQPYLRTALAHEFNHNNKVRINDQTFNNDVFGSRVELAAGVAMSVSKNVKLHADFETAKGKQIDQPWGVNFGVRYDF
ncbi:autotransporter outer membrane beta-barrel domain-containing protein [Pseudomonas palleroniana]|uniref:autotransporter outer membrane beta-barrel domain-containing protein n=1 Tax=Pseudomonas palleroniana TaxID=191390 RepID=UPI0018E6A2DF|nr:autotransporter outer membrane beta-barrel domain-containing protein [Pseudomonas palleroniana]MBI6911448.1 autotransporter outer membrane beta-barrel domain-containing protein [Pseudomonas palleroniana]